MIVIKVIRSVKRLIFSVLTILVLSACSNMPESIQYENPEEISLLAVQQGAINLTGQTVRWGGVITQVINNENDTWVEILALNLNDSGRPSSSRFNNDGRFIAKIDQFLDPEVYQQGYSFTVVGTLADKIDGKIGEFNYSYPVIQVDGHYIWPKKSPYRSHYVVPGYWYYGFHPHWRFGYSYYGYGVRSHQSHYYPYHPFYGHMTRRATPVTKSIVPGIIVRNGDAQSQWKFKTQRLTNQWRQAKAVEVARNNKILHKRALVRRSAANNTHQTSSSPRHRAIQRTNNPRDTIYTTKEFKK
ncbi:MAG: hypothetical protein COA74_01800 [Gammaproteobacteria bacterium]|nr:MAG: hypothetical protein COA74_01800 [Gammaproteobacteria bacterium]